MPANPTVSATLSTAEVAKVKEALAKWGDVVRRRLRQATAVAASNVERDAKNGFGGDYAEDIHRTVIGAEPLPTPPYKEQSDLMPHRRTQKLVGSIRNEKQGEGDMYHVIAGNSDAPYAAFVEFGTSRARPHPYMFPAAEMNRKGWREEVEKAIKDPTGVMVK
jgi:HK97 gp10 family phage protein